MHDEQKPREPEIAPELTVLEQQLRRMTPAAPRVDRDRLMFAAGEAAGAATIAERDVSGSAIYDRTVRAPHIAGPSWAARRFWPAATFTMTAATLLFATILVWQRRPVPFPAPGYALPSSTNQASEQPHMAIAPSPSELASSSFGPRTSQLPSNGYLGIRYAALTRGVSAWRPRSQDSAGDGDSYDETPRTQRKMLEELLPSRKREINPSF